MRSAVMASILLLLALPLAARQRSAPLENAALYARLRAIADTTGLRALEAELHRSLSHARASAGSAILARDHVAAGLLALRRVELGGGREHLRSARDAFERARDRDDDSPWPHFGIALTHLREPRADPTMVVGQVFERALGLDPDSRARRSLERALQLDSTFTPAAIALASVSLAHADRDALALALSTLRAARDAGIEDLEARLALSRGSAGLGDLETAAAAAREALVIAPRSADATYAYAVALLRTSGHEELGARAYFDAASLALSAPPASRSPTFDFRPSTFDSLLAALRPIARPSELAEFDSADALDRIRAFWALRAALADVSVTERLAEHYRRLASAADRYPRRARWGAPPRNALLLERRDAPFDDRGVILVRHGEPTEVIRTLGRDIVRNESWVYTGTDGRTRMFHFAEYADYPEWLLVYNLPCGDEWMGDRAGHDRRLHTLVYRCDAADLRGVSAEVRRDAYDALRTDSHRPGFTRALPFAYDLYTFRGPAGTTEVVAAFSLPVAGLDNPPALEASLIVADTLTSTVARRDTLLRAATTAMADAALDGDISIFANPTTGAVHRIVLRDANDDLHGQLLGGEARVPDYRGDTLMISDVVLGVPDSAGRLRRGDVRLRVAPDHTFSSSDLEIFYEIYNAPAGEAWVTELRVERVGGGLIRGLRNLFGAPPMRLRFEDSAPAEPPGTLRYQRRLSGNLDKGRYRLTLRVIRSGTTLERSTLLTIR